jgi:hypothetical protein
MPRALRGGPGPGGTEEQPWPVAREGAAQAEQDEFALAIHDTITEIWDEIEVLHEWFYPFFK